MEYNQNIEMARRIAQCVAGAGGTVYYVGGMVRDRLMGVGQKAPDVDIEVHGILPEQLEAILDTLGERQMFGASFGIYNLRHYDIDIAMPRKEKRIGEKHTDFRCEIDPFCGTYQAAIRRDFTVNALMQNVLTDEMVDHFGGVKDLRNGIIRHVSAGTFAEDALRVLRAAQFSARFDFSIAPETISLCSGMNLNALAGERVLAEMRKALMKADHPSVFFSQLRQMNQLSTWFPEIEALQDVPQSPVYHPEGDAWQHTMLTLDGAAALRDKALQPWPFMLSALLHDCGKAVSTIVNEETGKISSIGHENSGVPLALALMHRLKTDKKTEQYVVSMIRLHMKPNLLPVQQSRPKAYMIMFDEALVPEDLILLSKADRIGQRISPAAFAETETLLRDMLSRYRNVIQKQPKVSGDDLMKAGFKPGKELGQLLAYAHKLWLSGIAYENALDQTIQYGKKLHRSSV